MMKNLKSPKGILIVVAIIISALLVINYLASHKSKERFSTLIHEYSSGLLAKNSTHAIDNNN